MDAVDEGALALLERLGCGHIGLDHELFDQPVGLEALAYADRLHAAVFAQFDAAFWKVEIEGAASVACLAHGPVASEQGLQHGVEEGGRLLVRVVVEGVLCFAVSQPCGRPHQGTLEAVGFHPSVGAECQAAGDDGPVLSFFQRAQVG